MSHYIEDDNSWKDNIENKIKSSNARNRPTPLQTINNNFLVTGPATRAGAPVNGAMGLTPTIHVLDLILTTTVFLLSTSVILDGLTNNLILQNINISTGRIKDGTIITLKPKTGKKIILRTAGNINTSQDITVLDNQFIWLEYFADSGLWNILTAGAVGGGAPSTLWSTTTIDINKDMGQHALQNLDFISFDNASGNLSRLIDGIVGTGITYNVPAGEGHYIKLGNTEFVRITALSGLLLSTFLDLGGNFIANTGAINPQSDVASDIGNLTHRYNKVWTFQVGTTNSRLIDFSLLNQINYSIESTKKHSFQINNVETLGISDSSVVVTGALTVTGQSSLNGNVVLGNNSSNTISYGGVVGTDILPKIDLTYNLGGLSNRWIDLFVQKMLYSSVRYVDLNGVVNGIKYAVDLNEKHSFQVNNIEVLQIAGSQVNITGTLTISGQTNHNGPVFLGNISTDTITFAGLVGSDIIDKTDLTYKLGDSTHRWSALWIQILEYSSTRLIDLNGIVSGIKYAVAAGEKHSFQINNVEALQIAGSQVNVTGTLSVSNTASLNGNVFLGNNSANSITYGGLVNSDILPDSANTRNIGGSGSEWIVWGYKYAGRSKNGIPTTTDIPAGMFQVYKNTGSGLVTLWYNDAGILRRVDLA